MHFGLSHCGLHGAGSGSLVLCMGKGLEAVSAHLIETTSALISYVCCGQRIRNNGGVWRTSATVVLSLSYTRRDDLELFPKDVRVG
jgi:hypothetical protein